MSNSQVIPQGEAKSALKGYTTSKELLHYTLFMPCTHIMQYHAFQLILVWFNFIHRLSCHNLLHLNGL